MGKPWEIVVGEVRRRLRDEDRKLKDPLKPIHPKWLERARAA